MIVAIWIIAICEVVRAAQNMMQLMMAKHDVSQRDNAYSEFVKSLKETDRDFVKKMLKEFDSQEKKDDVVGVKLNPDYSWSAVKRGDDE